MALLKHSKVIIHLNTVPTECVGNGDLLTEVTTRNTQTGKNNAIEASGLFYAIGHVPATSLLKGRVDLDETGYIQTVPGFTRIKVEGVFAAGDVQDKRCRQSITTFVSTGCMTASETEPYVLARNTRIK